MFAVLRFSRFVRITCLAGVVAMVALTGAVRAENKLGGHFGFVIPLVNHVNGDTTTVADDFVVGFPMGITVKKTDKVAFDMEFVPVIQNDPLKVNLTLHPGVIWALPHRFAAGLRMAFDVKDSSWGFTPLLNRSFPLSDGTAFFTEFVLPIRIQDIKGDNKGSIGFGIHFGVGF